jgi:heptosyltransferase-3
VPTDTDVAARENPAFLVLCLTMASPLQDPVPLHLVRRALVTKLRHHGDVLLASPVFTALARAAPGIEIDALVYLETAPMLTGHPAIAQLHAIDRGWKQRGVLEARRMGTAYAARSRLRPPHSLTEHPRGLALAHLAPRWSVTASASAPLWRRRAAFLPAPRTERRSSRIWTRCGVGVYPTKRTAAVLVPGRPRRTEGRRALSAT